MTGLRLIFFFFFFNDTATTEIYTLSLHDALPILHRAAHDVCTRRGTSRAWRLRRGVAAARMLRRDRSEEHTSELQSRLHLVCRLLLEKKKRTRSNMRHAHNVEEARTPNVLMSGRL